jgi:hypothetical protein
MVPDNVILDLYQQAHDFVISLHMISVELTTTPLSDRSLRPTPAAQRQLNEASRTGYSRGRAAGARQAAGPGPRAFVDRSISRRSEPAT